MPEGYPQTHFMGICDECCTIVNFADKATRDWWESHHETHGGAE